VEMPTQSIIRDDCDDSARLSELMKGIGSQDRLCSRLSSEHSRVVRDLNQTLATLQSQCSHQWEITPPSILGLGNGSDISSRYCTLCEKGLGDLSDVPLLDVVPTRDDVMKQKDAYSAHLVRVRANERELARQRQEHGALQQQMQAQCKHEWGRCGRSSGCYGYESRERYCIHCDLTCT